MCPQKNVEIYFQHVQNNTRNQLALIKVKNIIVKIGDNQNPFIKEVLHFLLVCFSGDCCLYLHILLSVLFILFFFLYNYLFYISLLILLENILK